MRASIIIGSFIILSMLSYPVYAEYYVSTGGYYDNYRAPCHHKKKYKSKYKSHHRRHVVSHRKRSTCRIEVYYPCAVNTVWVASRCDCYGRCIPGHWQVGYKGDVGYMGDGNGYYAQPDIYNSPNYYRSEAIDSKFNQDMATGDDNAMLYPDMNNQY